MDASLCNFKNFYKYKNVRGLSSMIVGPFMVHVLAISSVAFVLNISFISKFSFFVSSARTCNSFKAHI